MRKAPAGRRMSRLPCLLLLLLGAGLACCRGGEAARPDAAAAGEPEGDRTARHYLAPLRFVTADRVQIRPARSLEQLRREGQLRVAFLAQPGLRVYPRGHPLPELFSEFEYLADYLGLELVPVGVSRGAQLLELLEQGRVEIIGEPLPSDSLDMAARCSSVVGNSDLLLVGGHLLSGAPASLNEAWLRRVWVPAGPDAEYWARLVAEHLSPAAGSLVVEPGRDHLQLLAELAAAARPGLALVTRRQLEEYRVYRDDVEEFFELARQVPLCWRVSPLVEGLLEAVNAYLYERSLNTHRRRRHRGDLDEVRAYGALRVVMLNNPVAYFIYRGQEVGFQYEVADLLARRLGVRLEVVVPRRPKDATRLVIDGAADVAFVSATAAAYHREQLAFTSPVHWSDQVLVQRAGEPPVRDLAQLAGRTIHVRASSQYYPTVMAYAAVVPWLRVTTVSEDLETEDIIELVARGELDLTVVNSVLLDAELVRRQDIQASLVLNRRQTLVLATRAEARKLYTRLQRFVERDCRGPWFSELVNKYLSNRPRIQQVRAESLQISGAISPYDDLAKRIGREFGIDWRLILAQAYKESRFNPRARSWAGARGLLQVMPQTGRQFGARDLYDPEINLRAGVAYLDKLMKSFEPSLPRRQRIRFALAAYNAGIGHVRDARRLAWRLGYDPNRWFGHVEKAMVLLEQPAYYHQARYGYCRGSETVQYVSEIQAKYEAYSRLAPAAGPLSPPPTCRGGPCTLY